MKIYKLLIAAFFISGVFFLFQGPDSKVCAQSTACGSCPLTGARSAERCTNWEPPGAVCTNNDWWCTNCEPCTTPTPTPMECPGGAKPGDYCGAECVECGVTSDRYYDSNCECVTTWTSDYSSSWCQNLCPEDTPVPTNTPTATPLPLPGPQCPDNLCNGSETCSSCPEDCGSCPPSPQPPVSTPTNTPRPPVGQPNPTATPTPTNTPVPTATPTQGPQCGGPCDPGGGGDQCPQACPICDPGSGGGGTCVAPTPTPTNTPAPTNTPIPTPTPTPDFNKDMCKCDSMNVQPDPIALGQPINVEAFAKVEGENTSKAEMQFIRFSVFKGDPSSGNRIEKIIEEDRPVTIVDDTPNLVRYSANWSTSPQIEVGEEYRIMANIQAGCVARTAALQSERQRVVLAQRDENVGFFGQIRNFFAGLFGGGSEVDENEGVQVQEQEENRSPLSFLTDIFRPQQSDTTERDQLQLDTFYPAQMEKEACNIMKFEFESL